MSRIITCVFLLAIGLGVRPAAAQREVERQSCLDACKRAGMICLLGVMSDPGGNSAYASACRACRDLVCGSKIPQAPQAPTAPKPEAAVVVCPGRTDQPNVGISWSPGKEVVDVTLKVGLSPGDDDIVRVGPMKGSSTGVDRIPPGKTVYVTLISHFKDGNDAQTNCNFASVGEAGIELAMKVYPAIFITGAPYRAITQFHTPDGCRDACKADANCKSYTYYKPEYTQTRTAYCELKSTATSYTANACCISGMKEPVPPPQPAATPPPPSQPAKPRGTIFDELLGQRNSLRLEPGYDRAGSDYRSWQMRNPDPAECQAACRDDANCRSFTFVRPGVQAAAAVCYLKSSVPVPSRNDCCTSGAK